MKNLILSVIFLFIYCIAHAQNCNCNITVCGKIWMTHNLTSKTYRNGDPIQQVTNPSQWSNLTTGAWCYYNNSQANEETYGILYNWYAVNDPRGLAPTGCHIPTWQEWVALSDCFGGDANSGGALKESGTTHWVFPNAGATNSSGFTALPGGWRSTGGGFSQIGFEGYWWSSNFFSPDYPWGRRLTYNTTISDGGGNVETHGFSVRCIKDN